MGLQNCPKCGKLFNYVHRNLCPDCIAEEDEEFNKVKEYLYEHPGATVIEISRETEVGEEKIMNYLRAGRLLVADSSRLMIQCERCGASIRSGRFCEACTRDLNKAFNRTAHPEPVREENSHEGNHNKMHTADWFKKAR